MAIKNFDDEIKRKALAGIALQAPTTAKQAAYDTYKAPQIQTKPTSSNVSISGNDLTEIQRKAAAGTPLEKYTPQKQELYNGYKNPAPTYQNYTAKAAPTYNSQYQGDISNVLSQLLNRQDFSYDAKSDPLFAQYKESYNREGDRALSNAMGEAMSLSGGRGNSYAMTAGQQAQNYYNAQLNDKIPELQQLAYNMYNQEIVNDRGDLSNLQGLEQMDQNQFRGTMSDYQDDRNFGYNQTQDANNYAYNKYNDTKNYDRGVIESDRNYDTDMMNTNNALAIDNRDFAYNQTRDAVGDGQWDKSFDRGAFENDRSFNRGVLENDRGFNYNSGQDSINNTLNQKKFDYQKEQDLLNPSSKTTVTNGNGLSYSQKFSQVKSILNETEPTYETDKYGKKTKTGTVKKNDVEAAYNRIMELASSEDEAIKLLNAAGISQAEVETAKRNRMQNDFNNSQANFIQQNR